MNTLEKIINDGKQVQHAKNEKMKDKEYKPLGKSTINIYITNLSKLHREIKTDIEIENFDWLLDKETIKEYINNLQSANTRKNYLTVIISVLYSNYDKYKNAIEFYIKLASNNIVDIRNNLKKDKGCSEGKIITMTEYDNLLNKLKKNMKYKVEYIILSILKHYPIRNEIFNLKYIKYSDYKLLDKNERLKFNWIVEKTNKMTMSRNDYKTSDIYNQINTDLNIEIKKMLKKYILDFDIESGDNLFAIKPQTMVSKLANTTESIVNIKIGTSTIFKIVCCDVLQRYKDTERIDMLRYYGSIRGTNLKNLIEYYLYSDVNDIPNDD
tara:strand:+ start:114 stop:1088 length:975 start_codon:yes stop_codon:yes gene_type:complete